MISVRVAMSVLVLAGSAGTVGAQVPSAAAQASPECVTQFNTIRSEAETRGMAAKTASEKQASREDMCKLVKDYTAAEDNLVNFAETNMSKCGIPNEILLQLKTVRARNAINQMNWCVTEFRLKTDFGPSNSRENYPGYRVGPDGYPFGPPRRPKPLELKVLDIAG
jgi:hypothetical protein